MIGKNDNKRLTKNLRKKSHKFNTLKFFKFEIREKDLTHWITALF